MRLSRAVSMLALSTMLFACAQGIPPDALALSPTSLADRQLQSRRYDTDEKTMLSATAQVLQDLGFNLDETETSLGVLVGSKDRDATDPGQVAAVVFVALLGGQPPPIDKNQKLRASVVTTPLGKQAASVRVTFQRTVWNTQGQISRIEGISDSKYYQEFFDKLSQALFLQAKQI